MCESSTFILVYCAFEICFVVYIIGRKGMESMKGRSVGFGGWMDVPCFVIARTL